MSPFRIISFDGGGIRGALSTRILKRLCEAYPQLLAETQLFAGTSTGALIALVLASGKDSEFIDNIYNYETIKSIFTPAHFNPFRPKYSNKNLKQVLSSVFSKDLTLAELEKYVFIPSFNVKGYTSNSWQSVFFNNLTNDELSKAKVIDVALSSSAAPTYFPSHNNFIDGGVIDNSPSASAMISTLKILKPKHQLSDFRVLSIGTGQTLDSIKKDTTSWGAVQWALNPTTKMQLPLVSILLMNDVPLADMYCRELIGRNYYRINPILNNEILLDDYKQVTYLKETVDTLDLSHCYRYIKNYFLK
ncbi:MAG: patatin-like phospholipase family protein [Clostridium sp.]